VVRRKCKDLNQAKIFDNLVGDVICEKNNDRIIIRCFSERFLCYKGGSNPGQSIACFVIMVNQ
jgi:hypothetical protein